jgi:hypothetical protein
MAKDVLSEENAKDRTLFLLTKEEAMLKDLVRIAMWKDNDVDFNDERIKELCSVAAEYLLSDVVTYNEQFANQKEGS